MDLIVFRVEMDSNGNRKFRESTKGIGKSCGSTFIDRNFRKHLRKKLKKVIRRSPNGTIEIPDAPLDHMMDIFVGNIHIYMRRVIKIDLILLYIYIYRQFKAFI